MSLFPEHEMRKMLAEEVHARPYGLARAPMRVSHLAVLSGEGGADIDRAHVADLCRGFGAGQPEPSANHHSCILSGDGEDELRFKWERHTEFSSFTFYGGGAFDDPFAATVIERIPGDWLRRIPGEVLAATHLGLESHDMPERDFDDLARLFGDNTVTGSGMRGGEALVWTDFRLHGDGFGRILVRDVAMNQRQAGRLVQRLLEVATYRMMAMLGFPLARKVLPRVSAAEKLLSALIDHMAESGGSEAERENLHHLTDLAAGIEALSIESAYRFAATRAYHALVDRRIGELREVRIGDISQVRGLQPPGEFVTRRLIPAMETCRSAEDRLDKLAIRIGRASDLLRTRVDVALEEQNRDLLKSMDRRARVQLRLQETVEGLSVVAVSYYLLGLVSYAAKSAKAAGAPIDADIFTGIAVPVVLGIVWIGLRRLHRSLSGKSGD